MFRPGYLISLLLVACQLAFASPGGAVSGDAVTEKQLRTKHGVERWVIDHEGTNLKSFRASRIVEIQDPYAFVAIALDYDLMSRWMHMTSTSETLAVISKYERHGRIVSKVPWPFSDREALAVGKILPQKDDRTIEYFYESDTGLLPPAEGLLRVPEFVGHITLELLEDSKAKITMEATVDPGGNIPKFLVHMMMRDVPYYSLIKLERLMNTPDFVGRKGEFPEVSFPESW